VWRAKPPPAQAPSADDVAEARRRFAKGVRLYREEGSVDAALVELQRAYDLAPNYRVLYNIGQIGRTLRDYALSLHAFQRYLEDGGDEIDKERKLEIEAEILELRDYVASIEVVVSEDGAVVSVDDAVVGVSPLSQTIVVNAGRRRFRAELDGRAATKALTIAGGDRDTIALELVATKRDAKGNGDDRVGGDEADSTTPVWVWIGFGATGLFAAGAVVTGSVALSDSGKLDDQRYAGAVPDSLNAQRDRVQALAITTDVLAIAAGATLVGTVIAWAVLGNDEPDEVKPKNAVGIRITGTPGWGLGMSMTY
jgi:tetratricopeptide (TPR) repeat protein